MNLITAKLDQLTRARESYRHHKSCALPTLLAHYRMEGKLARDRNARLPCQECGQQCGGRTAYLCGSCKRLDKAKAAILAELGATN